MQAAFPGGAVAGSDAKSGYEYRSWGGTTVGSPGVFFHLSREICWLPAVAGGMIGPVIQGPRSRQSRISDLAMQPIGLVLCFFKAEAECICARFNLERVTK